MRAGVCQTMSELNNGEGKERSEEREREERLNVYQRRRMLPLQN